MLRSTIDKRSFSALNLPTFMYSYSYQLKVILKIVSELEQDTLKILYINYALLYDENNANKPNND